MKIHIRGIAHRTECMNIVNQIHQEAQEVLLGPNHINVACITFQSLLVLGQYSQQDHVTDPLQLTAKVLMIAVLVKGKFLQNIFYYFYVYFTDQGFCANLGCTNSLYFKPGSQGRIKPSSGLRQNTKFGPHISVDLSAASAQNWFIASKVAADRPQLLHVPKPYFFRS